MSPPHIGSSPSGFRKSILLGVLIFFAVGIGGVVVFRVEKAREGQSSGGEVQSAADGREGTASAGSAATPPASPATASDGSFARFSEWLAEFLKADPAARRSLAGRGTALAQERREWMRRLIEKDPEEALRRAIAIHEWLALPEEIRKEVEEPFSGRPDVIVMPDCVFGEELPKALRAESAGMTVEATMADGAVLRSFVFGRREGLVSMDRTPLQGIRLEDVAALRERIFQPLDASELAAAQQLYAAANPDPGRGFASGEVLGRESVAALAGGRIFYFENRAALDAFEARARKLEELPGPESGPTLIFETVEALAAGDEFDWDQVESSAEEAAEAWTGTPRTIYAIMVDTSDVPGQPTDPAVLENTLNNEVAQMTSEMSYGKTYTDAVVDTATYRLPEISTYYNGTTDTAGNPPGDGTRKNTLIWTTARDLAEAATGLDIDGTYDTVMIYLPSMGMGYAGLAAVNGQRLWMHNNNRDKVLLHELGHNFGLGHSSWWEVAGSDPVDPAGTNREYANFTDIMGGGELFAGHFRAEGKQRLNWFDPGQWQDAASSGTYRVYRFDSHETDPTNALRALRIAKGGGEFYWIGHRQQYLEADVLARGAYLDWQKATGRKTWIIDSTPASAFGKYDGGIALGQTYSDAAAQAHMTVVGYGGYDPDQYIDVEVNLGAFAGNNPPAGSLSPLPASVTARTNTTWTATANDPDGDALAYHWDFGDGVVLENAPSVTHSWAAGGSRTVNCTVSDMKGGAVTLSHAVSVLDPINTWTQRVSGTGQTLRDIAVDAAGTTALAVGNQATTSTSADGITWVAAQLPGAAVGFDLWGVAYDATNALWIAVGVESGSGAIYTSPDAATWTLRHSGGSALRKVASSGSANIAVGLSGTILRSTDGISWSAATSGTTSELEGVAFGAGGFVAAGDNGGGIQPVILSSPAGVTWTDRSAGIPYVLGGDNIEHLRFLGDRFVMSGSSSFGVHYSTDGGETFPTFLLIDRRGSAEASSPRYRMAGLAHGAGIFFGAGVDQRNSSVDTNIVSLDGAKWFPLDLPAAQPNRNAAAFFQDTFVTVGASGNIWQSAAVSPPAAGWAVWQLQHAAALGSKRGPFDDIDMDGDENVMEYAIGTLPANYASSSTEITAAVDGSGFLEITIPRDSIKGDVEYTVERSTNLENWSEIDTVVVTDTNLLLVVRSSVLASTLEREYLRLRVRLL